jgi:aryl-alcohol dehydrogenase-like predicted oxidoreductase
MHCRFTIASKANAFPLYNKSLSAESVRGQMASTLAALRAPSVDIYYLHAPDIHTPIEETLAGECGCMRRWPLYR